MKGIFDGLEKFGIKKKDIESAAIFEKPKSDNKKGSDGPKEFDIKDYVIQKPHECPICDRNFTAPAIKSGKIRLDRIDYDLRPIYENIEPIFYDVIMCNHCGYAAVSQKFRTLPDRIASMLLEYLSASFVPIPTVETIDINSAIDRYKMALFCATKREAKDGERAYICLKLSWLYRILGSRSDEVKFMAFAYKGFKKAYSTESMPICGLNEHTIMFLLATFSKNLGNIEESVRYLSSLIVDRTAPNNLKERARDLRDEIQKK